MESPISYLQGGHHAASLEISSVCLGVQIKECAIFLLIETYPKCFTATGVVSSHSYLSST